MAEALEKIVNFLQNTGRKAVPYVATGALTFGGMNAVTAETLPPNRIEVNNRINTPRNAINFEDAVNEAYLNTNPEDATITYKINFHDGSMINEVTNMVAKRRSEDGTTHTDTIYGKFYSSTGEVVFDPASTAVGDIAFDHSFKVGNIYSNPASEGYETIPLQVGSRSDISVQVYDMSGKNVGSYVFHDVSPGQLDIELDLNSLTSGTYNYVVSNGTSSFGGKALVLDGSGGNSVKFSSNLSPNDYSNYTEWIKPKSLNTGGIVYDIEIDGDTFVGFKDNVTVTGDDVNLEKFVGDQINGPSEIEIYGIEGGNGTFDLNAFTSPTGALTYEVLNYSNNLEIEKVNYLLEAVGIDDDVNGLLTGDSVLIKAVHGGELRVPVKLNLEARADLKIQAEDAILETAEGGIGVTLNGEVVGETNADGYLNVQLDEPGNYILRAKKTGMFTTEVELLNIVAEDDHYITVPVVHEPDHPIFKLLTDVNMYGGGDRETHYENVKFRIPNNPGLEEGTFATGYINLESSRATHEVIYNNLKRGVEVSPVSSGGVIRFQDPDDNNVFKDEISVSSEADEGKILADFLDGKIYPELDVLVIASHYAPSVNVVKMEEDANGKKYAKKGVVVLRASSLMHSSLATSEMAQMIGCYADPYFTENDTYAKGSTLGEAIDMNDDSNLTIVENLYRRVDMSKGGLGGKMQKNLPSGTDVNIQEKKITLPKIEYSPAP